MTIENQWGKKSEGSNEKPADLSNLHVYMLGKDNNKPAPTDLKAVNNGENVLPSLNIVATTEFDKDNVKGHVIKDEQGHVLFSKNSRETSFINYDEKGNLTSISSVDKNGETTVLTKTGDNKFHLVKRKASADDSVSGEIIEDSEVSDVKVDENGLYTYSKS
ncbi:MAG: hypothetical protein JST89_00145 [Cyanobacteria bacterium SZAS-4]|nr:hypothetical protein [Cyanobacteria bacterium SZAS-4]